MAERPLLRGMGAAHRIASQVARGAAHRRWHRRVAAGRGLVGSTFRRRASRPMRVGIQASPAPAAHVQVIVDRMKCAAWGAAALCGSSRLLGTALGLVALVGAGLRLSQTGESLWLDELHTAWCALAPLGEVAARAADGNQGPLFFWLEWGLVRLLGASELALRGASVAAGTGLVVLVGVWVARHGSSWAALTAAALVAIDPYAIFWGSEARPYALVQALGAAHVLAVGPLLTQATRRWRAFWVLTGAVLFHLHYTSVLLLVAEGVIAGLWWALWPQRVVYRPAQAARDVLVLLLLMWPAASTLASISQRRANWALFVEVQPLHQLLAWWPLACGLFLIVGAKAAHAVLRWRGGGLSGQPSPGPALEALLTVACWLLVPASLAWLATETDVARLFFPRYLAACLPAAAILGAWTIDLAPGRWGKVVAAGVLLGAGVYAADIVPELQRTGRPIAHRREDWRSAVAWLQAEYAAHPAPVLLYSGIIEADVLREGPTPREVAYCLFPLRGLYRLKVPDDALIPLPRRRPRQDYLLPPVKKRLAEAGSCWLVVRAPSERARWAAVRLIAELYRHALAQQVDAPTDGTEENAGPLRRAHRWRIVQRQEFGDLSVLRLARTAPRPDLPTSPP